MKLNINGETHDVDAPEDMPLLWAIRDLAIRFLEADRLEIPEIALRLGFSEPSAFYRAFRRWTGHTPAEHRARAKEA